ncbi:MAG: sortase [Lachnospiraceae bacterium]|nr:sortase [Lachnospiraceae bacterium]
MRRRIGSFCMALGGLMLIAAIALLAYNRWDDWRAGNSVARIQDELENEREAGRTDLFSDSGTADAGTSKAGSDEGSDTEMAEIEIDGYAYIGTLSVSRFGLELPVMSEWSYPGLRIAPGRYSGSVRTDDLVICGHNYERHFGNLKNLEAGDEITFTDVDGNSFDYVVDEVLILQPTDIEEMLDGASDQWDLTLFTCTVGGQTRVTVRCSRGEEDG